MFHSIISPLSKYSFWQFSSYVPFSVFATHFQVVSYFLFFHLRIHMLRVGTDENAALEGPSAGDGAHLLDAFEAYGETGLARFSRFEIMLLFDFLCLS